MTHFKIMLTIAALFSIGAAHAKQVGKKVTTTPMPASTQTPIIPRTPKSTSPKPQPAKTFTQLWEEVKHAKNAWDSKTQRLSDNFVKNLVDDAQTADINNQQLSLLLNLARDSHAQFTGPTKDIDILRNLNDQREKIVKTF